MSRTPFTIRPATLADARATADLLNAIIETGRETSMASPFSHAEQEQYLRTYPPRGVFLVAEDPISRGIVGLQSIEPQGPEGSASGHVAEISTFVAASHRRLGVGCALFEALLPAAAAKGFRKIVATIREDNPIALAFYGRRGFRTVGVLVGHALYRGRYLNQVVAELQIVPRED